MRKLIERATSEVSVWSLALLGLYLFGHVEGGPTLCLFHWIGLEACLGCGLGHAIHDAMHFRFGASVEHHPLGIPVLLLLLFRIHELTRSRTKQPTTWTRTN